MGEPGAVYTFVVIAFPVAPSRDAKQAQRLAAIGPEVARMVKELTQACGEPPKMLQPDLSAICMLAHGTFERIAQAVDAARASDTSAFIARIDTPIECIGLAPSATWLKAHGLEP